VRGRVATSHVIDPETLRPAGGRIASVSVLAKTGAMADAWATALLAAGAAGPALARRREIVAMFQLDRPSAPGRITTGNFTDALLA
jgi:thiamine biosynthesis lipoprotein